MVCLLVTSVNPAKTDKPIAIRGVVVRERGGTPFRQIFWSQNGTPANIVGHRWNANTEAFRQITSYSLGWPLISLFSGPNCPQRGIWHQKSQKIFRDSLSGRGRPHPAPTPSTATRRARGRKLPRCWGLGLGNRSPKSKFTTTPLIAMPFRLTEAQGTMWGPNPSFARCHTLFCPRSIFVPLSASSSTAVAMQPVTTSTVATC